MKYIELNIDLEQEDEELEQLKNLGVSVNKAVSNHLVKTPLTAITGWMSNKHGKAEIFIIGGHASIILDITESELEELIKNPKEL